MDALLGSEALCSLAMTEYYKFLCSFSFIAFVSETCLKILVCKCCWSGLWATSLLMSPARQCRCILHRHMLISTKRCLIVQPPSFLLFWEEESSPFFCFLMDAGEPQIHFYNSPTPYFKLLTVFLAGLQWLKSTEYLMAWWDSVSIRQGAEKPAVAIVERLLLHLY